MTSNRVQEMEFECPKKDDAGMYSCAINELGKGREDETINIASVNGSKSDGGGNSAHDGIVVEEQGLYGTKSNYDWSNKKAWSSAALMSSTSSVSSTGSA